MIVCINHDIKQLFHGGLVNSQNYCPEVMRMTMVDYCPRPKAEGNSPPWSSLAPKIVRVISMKLGTLIKHDEITCRAKEP